MAGQLICRVRKRLRSGFELDAHLAIPLDRSRVTVLFGPSGSGKTTLLRLLAGLDRPDEGVIACRGDTWYDSSRGVHLPPQRRRAGFLFQDYALFPHLTVAANVAFAGGRERAAALMQTFGIADLAALYPRAISGGQQQRVALARALAAGSALLLLDEPLSALDAAGRVRLRTDLRRMLLAGGVPSILVTHDRAEAIALGDWMAVLVDGRIRQTRPVRDVLRHPAGARVAESVGVENVLPPRSWRASRACSPCGWARGSFIAWTPARPAPYSPASTPMTWPSAAAWHVRRACATASPGGWLRIPPGGRHHRAIGRRDGSETGRRRLRRG
jgi:molybdate transport system ATP-binding protein